MGFEVQIRNIVAIPLGLIVASGAAAAILALLASDWKLFPPAFAIVLIVAVGAGLPIYLTARAARKDTPRIAAALGFAVGAVIPAILVFWSIPDQASVGGTVTVLDGRYTLAGWLQNLALLGGFGMLGVWRRLVVLASCRSRAKEFGARWRGANASSATDRPAGGGGGRIHRSSHRHLLRQQG